MSNSYLETSLEEVTLCIAEQLAGFLLAARVKEFKTLYYQVDGQTIIAPLPKQKSVPRTYRRQKDFWEYTSDTAIWDIYWGNFIFDLADGMTEISGLVPDFDFDVSDSVNEGCDLDGCDLDGCDLDGCDLDGCNIFDF